MLVGISSLFMIVFLIICIFVLQNKVNRLQEQQFKNLCNNKDLHLEDKIIHMYKAGKTEIEIIKIVRQEVDLGLLQAKRYVESVLSNSSHLHS